MKKYLIILLMAMLPTLALAQQAGGHITRPGKTATTTTKPAKKQTTKKQSTSKPPKKQSSSSSASGSSGHSQTSNPSKPAMANKTFIVGGVSFTMVAVEGGTFAMGGTSEQGSDAYDDEKPTHLVTLSSFYIGQTEVTQALWQAVMENNPSKNKDPEYPVERVSWGDCQKFIQELNKLTGQNFKLPTEAQWEYAARGGNKSLGYKYSGSNNLDDVAWYEDNSGSTRHKVATKRANELGIYDMSGTVWEWCQDWYGDYNSSSQIDPSGPLCGTNRVHRGGCENNSAKACRVTDRKDSTPERRDSYLGLRLAL